jgi:hypothetical protein
MKYNSFSVNEKIKSQRETGTLLTRACLANRWNCSVATIKRRERSGILKPICLGRLIRFNLNAIEEIEKSATQRP